MMRRAGRQGGFVLILVIGVLTVLFIDFWAARSALEYTYLRGQRAVERAERAEATASIMAMVMTPGPPMSGQARTLDWNLRLKAEYRLQPLTPQDPFWTSLGWLRAQSGDALLTIDWMTEGVPPARVRYLINLEGRRAGAIAVTEPPPAPPTPDPTPTGNPSP